MSDFVNSLDPKTELQEKAIMAQAGSVRSQMNIKLELYYADNGRLPSSLKELLTYDTTLDTIEVETLISYRLVDETHAELCYIIKDLGTHGPRCIIHVE